MTDAQLASLIEMAKKQREKRDKAFQELMTSKVYPTVPAPPINRRPAPPVKPAKTKKTKKMKAAPAVKEKKKVGRPRGNPAFPEVYLRCINWRQLMNFKPGQPKLRPELEPAPIKRHPAIYGSSSQYGNYFK